jgi:hypothetical protein
MKNTFLFLALVLISTTPLTSCKKKGCTDINAVNYNEKAKKDDGSCLYVPTISIIGAADTSISVGTTYNDPGATAVNKDGTSVNVTVDNQVDATTTGTYEITYTATNANGTATAKRTVNVVVGQDNWTVTWDVSSNCGTAFPLAATPSVSAGSSANTLIIDNMFNLVGGTANATINGATITIPQQTVNITVGDVIFSGIGTMNAQGNILTITYTYENTTPLIGGSGTCVATYVKQ